MPTCENVFTCADTHMETPAMYSLPRDVSEEERHAVEVMLTPLQVGDRVKLIEVKAGSYWTHELPSINSGLEGVPLFDTVFIVKALPLTNRSRENTSELSLSAEDCERYNKPSYWRATVKLARLVKVV